MPALVPCQGCRGAGEADTLSSTCCHVSGQCVPNTLSRPLPSPLERMTTPVSAMFTSVSSRRHGLGADVKGVTWQRLQVVQTSNGWEATVGLDV